MTITTEISPVTTKADRTPVTQADVECEQAIRDLILERFPEHGFYGEETGQSRADADYLWLVDPIDGTKAFVRQYPFFSTQIALLHARRDHSRRVVGHAVQRTCLGRKRPWRLAQWPAPQRQRHRCTRAGRGVDRQPAFARPQRRLGSGSAKQLAVADRTRGYGDFYHYHLLAAGKIEAVVESDVNILDIAALSIIVSEAGGVFTDLNGAAVGLDTRSVLATNAALHGHYLAALRGFVADGLCAAGNEQRVRSPAHGLHRRRIQFAEARFRQYGRARAEFPAAVTEQQQAAIGEAHREIDVVQ